MLKHLKFLLLAASLVAVFSIPAGCETMEGAGQDVENAGEAVEDAAD